MKAGIEKDSGFTLLEMLISLSLIAVLVLIIGNVLRLGFRSIDSGERKVGQLERFKTSLNIVDSQIQSIIPLGIPLVRKGGDSESGDKEYFFRGKQETMQFPTNYSLWGEQRGYAMVAYRIETGDNGKQALYAAESTIGMENGREVRLFDSLDGIAFEYFFRDPTEEKGGWVEEWTSRDTLPEKIRMRLTDGTGTLSMVIPVRAKTPPVEQMGSGLES